jgi:hypothetical protein
MVIWGVNFCIEIRYQETISEEVRVQRWLENV